jgi:hypothetical protein
VNVDEVDWPSGIEQLLGEARADVIDLLAGRAVRRAAVLSEETGLAFAEHSFPMYFTGDFASRLVLVHLNPKLSDRLSEVTYPDFEKFIDAHRRFGYHHWGSDPNYRSAFDHKQVRFLRPFNAIDFVSDSVSGHTRENLIRAIDNKLQLELIPYASPTFSNRDFPSVTLAPHFERVLGVITAYPRDYVIFCDVVFDRLLNVGNMVIAREDHRFHLPTATGTSVNEYRFSNVTIRTRLRSKDCPCPLTVPSATSFTNDADLASQATRTAMSAKEDLFAAARSLHAQGTDRFSLMDVISEARRLGSTYPDVTLRSMVSHHLRIDKRNVAGGVGFFQVSRGFYRLASNKESPVTERVVRPIVSTSDRTTEERAPTPDDEHEWFWEGNVQATLVRHLANDGWRIRRVADTHSREHGVDIEADRSGVTLLIEVKGYPSATYLKGPNEGQKKNFGVGAQARTYFGNAVLTGLLMRSDNSDARVVLVFPALETFRALARRSALPLDRAGIEIWLVDDSGRVVPVDATEVESTRPGVVNVSGPSDETAVPERTSKFEWRPEDIVILKPDDEDYDEDGDTAHN